MLDLLTKLAPAFASIVGVAVALLVYRINADKLFLEMLAARRDAAREVLDAAHARDLEITNLPMGIDHPSAYNLPEQARFWRASNAAEGLFGPEVGDVLANFDRAVMEKIAATLDLRAPRHGRESEQAAFIRHAAAVGDLVTVRQDFVAVTRRYTHLGRRGLPVLQRCALWTIDRRQRREKKVALRQRQRREALELDRP